jgi:hypothetical protein
MIAPPSSDMNSRRFMSDMGACSPALCQRRTPEGLPRTQGYHGGDDRSLGRPELF